MREVCFCGRSGDVRDSESILDDKHLKQFDLGMCLAYQRAAIVRMCT